MSLVIPVYRNEEGIDSLLRAVQELSEAIGDFEAVFVVDGSPDESHLRLLQQLPSAPFRSQLLSLSRNFGSFAAIRAGLAAAKGERLAVMAADLQEPPELILRFDEQLRTGDCDVVIGRRLARSDPGLSKLAATIFWGVYRRAVMPEVPPGGVDVFGCTRAVRDTILAIDERNTSLVGLLFWVGYRRSEVEYERQAREHGTSGWTFAKKLRYLSDSVFSFSDLPIRLLLYAGALGLLTSAVFATVVLAAKLAGQIPVPGYAATVLVVTFFGGLNCYGLGVLGGYVWRTYENTKGRPGHIVRSHQEYSPREGAA